MNTFDIPALGSVTSNAFTLGYCEGAVPVNVTSDYQYNMYKPNSGYVVALDDQPNKAQKKKEQNMCYECDGFMNETEAQRGYLNSRAYNINGEKSQELRKQFHINDDETPQTLNKIVQRIKDGLYEIPKEYADKDMYNPISYIRWRDPSKPADQDGWKVADKKLGKAYIKTMDDITVLPTVDALASLREFESTTIN